MLPGRRWLSIVLIVLSFGGGVASGEWFSAMATGQSSVVEVRATIDRGSNFRLYYNNMWSEPQVASIVPGRETTYRFSVPSRLIALRFDPSDEPGAEMSLRDVTIRSGSASATLATDQLQHWLRANLDVAYDPATATARVLVRERAAYMMGGVDIDLTQQPWPLLRYFRLNAITLLWCLFGTGAVFLLLSTPRRDLGTAAGVMLIVLISIGAAYVVAPRVLSGPGELPDVSQTVGHHSYFGRSKALEMRATNRAIAAALAMTLVLGWWLRRVVQRGVASAPAPATASASIRPTRGELILLAASVLLFAIASLPTAALLYQRALIVRHPIDFDSMSALAWQYLNATGMLPYRDYWFPYSGNYDQLAPLYPEVTVSWEHAILLFGVVTIGAYAAVKRSVLGVFALFAVWFYLVGMGPAMGMANVRYFLAPSLILATAVALQQRTWWSAGALGVWMFYVLQEEISQPVYAAPGMTLLVLSALWHPPEGQTRRQLFTRLLVTGATFGVCFVLFLISLFRHDQLAQWWEFIATLNVQANYSGWPADISSWFTVPDTVDQFFVLIIIALVVGGALQAVWSRGRDLYLLVPVCIGAVSVMLLQKQMIRPGIESQVLAVPIFGLTLLVTQQLRLRPAPLRYAAWTLFSAAFLISCFTWSMQVNRDRVAAYLDIGSDLTSDLAYSVMASERWAPARAAYFAASSVVVDGMPGDAFAERVRQLTGITAQDNIFVLGDTTPLYMILQRPIAFYANLYNQSPLFCQRKTMAWMDQYDPKYLFWDPAEKAFDNVPNPVRVPLLFNRAIAQFVPLGKVGRFEVLRKRQPSEPVALAFWRERLGTSLDLGFIPAATDVLTQAHDRGDVSMRYVVATVRSFADGAKQTITFRLAGEPYTVQFTTRLGVSRYAIAVDRLPFASAGDVLGVPPAIVSASPGVTVALERFLLPRERLY
jgi:hypothetical protein